MTSTENKFSQHFHDMALRVERNLTDEFAGAILIVPPIGDAIAVMVADPSKDPEAFWAVASAKIQIAISEFNNTRTNSGQGFRR